MKNMRGSKESIKDAKTQATYEERRANVELLRIMMQNFGPQ